MWFCLPLEAVYINPLLRDNNEYTIFYMKNKNIKDLFYFFPLRLVYTCFLITFQHFIRRPSSDALRNPLGILNRWYLYRKCNENNPLIEWIEWNVRFRNSEVTDDWKNVRPYHGQYCRQYSNQDMYITMNESLYETFMQSQNKKSYMKHIYSHKAKCIYSLCNK